MAKKGIYVFRFKEGSIKENGFCTTTAAIYPNRTTMIGQIDLSAKTYQNNKLTEAGKKRVLREIQAKLGVGINPEMINWDSFRVLNSSLTDKEIHRILDKNGYHRVYTLTECKPTEMFDFDEEDGNPVDIVSDIIAYKESFRRNNKSLDRFVPNSFQIADLEILLSHFKDGNKKNFYRLLLSEQTGGGKTYITLWYVKYSGATRVIIKTYKPDVISQWIKTINTHIDFTDFSVFDNITEYMEFVNNPENKDRVAILCVSSYGFKKNNNYQKYEVLNDFCFDVIVNDEAHFGSWNEDKKEDLPIKLKGAEILDVTATPFPNESSSVYDAVAYHSLCDCYLKKDEIEKLA
jgi:hypothetical protein